MEIPAPDFDLEKTLDSGQVFHWEKVGKGFVGTIGDLPVCIEQRGEVLCAKVASGSSRSLGRDAQDAHATIFSCFALDHPLFGGGFWSIENDDLYRTYLDSYTTAFNAHSIWFNMLGEHGFPGLALFVGLISACWLSLRALRKSRDGVSPSGWIVSYSHMLELALLGYVVSGTFLSVAYLELFYQLVGAIILLHVIARRETAPEPAWIAVPHGEPGIGVNRVWDRWVR